MFSFLNFLHGNKNNLFFIWIDEMVLNLKYKLCIKYQITG